MAERIDIAQLNVVFAGDTSDLTRDVKQASQVLKDSFGKMEKAGDGVADSLDDIDDAADGFKSSATELNSKIQLIERGYDHLKQTINGAIDIAELGAQSQRVEGRFEKFAATIGDADDILAAFNRGAGGTVDKLTAMNAASQLIQQGLVGTSAEMEKTVEFATRLGDQTASATDRIGAFSQLLRNQSIMLLDNFGISSGKVRERIKELQAATEGLSREEAFRIAVFEEGQKSLDILGVRVDDNAAKMERATARIQDFRVEMGEKVVPVVAKVAGFVSELDTATIALAVSFASITGVAAKFSGGLGGLAGKMGGVNKETGKMTPSFMALGVAITGLVAAVEWTNKQFAEMNAAQEEAQEVAVGFGGQLNELTESGMSTGEAMAEMGDRLDTAAGKWNDMNIVARAGVNALGKSNEGTHLLAQATTALSKELAQGSDSYEEYISSVDRFNMGVTESESRLHALTQAQFEWQQSWDAGLAADQQAQWDSAGDLVAAVTARYGEYTYANLEAFNAEKKLMEVREQTIESIAKTVEGIDKATASTGDQIRALEEVETTWSDQANAAIRAAQVQDEWNVKADEAVVRAEEMTLALEAQEQAIEDARIAQEQQIATTEAQIKSNLALNEQLKDTDEQGVARAAIRELEKAQQAGLITFDDFTQAVVEVQDRFGLADDESRALTLGLGTLVEEFSTGGIAAGEFDDALGLLIEDAKDGVIAFDELKKKIADVGNQTTRTIEVIDAATGEIGEMLVSGDSGIQRPGGAAAAGGGQFDPGAGAEIIDALTGQVVSAPQQQQAPAEGVTIYGGLHVEGIQDVEDFLAQLQALTPMG